MTLKDLSEREQVEKEVIDAYHAVYNIRTKGVGWLDSIDFVLLGDAMWALRKIKNHFKEKTNGE